MVVPRNRPLISKSKDYSHGLTQNGTDQKVFSSQSNEEAARVSIWRTKRL
jgi:hypothetical protein